MIFPQKLSSGDYLFVYDACDNNVVGFIHPTPDSADTPEAYITDEDVVNTTVDDILEAMEQKMVRYVITLILDVGGNIKWVMTLTLCLTPSKKILYIYIYIWISGPTNGANDLVKGKNIIYLS